MVTILCCFKPKTYLLATNAPIAVFFVLPCFKSGGLLIDIYDGVVGYLVPIGPPDVATSTKSPFLQQI